MVITAGVVGVIVVTFLVTFVPIPSVGDAPVLFATLLVFVVHV